MTGTCMLCMRPNNILVCLESLNSIVPGVVKNVVLALFTKICHLPKHRKIVKSAKTALFPLSPKTSESMQKYFGKKIIIPQFLVGFFFS